MFLLSFDRRGKLKATCEIYRNRGLDNAGTKEKHKLMIGKSMCDSVSLARLSLLMM